MLIAIAEPFEVIAKYLSFLILNINMAVIQTKCWVQKPVDGYYRDCFAGLGIEYQTWLSLIIISLIIGFGAYYIYSLVHKTKFEVKNFVIKSLLVSLVVLVILFLVILLILQKWLMSNIIY